MRAIFISYRREDSEGQAGRLFDDLVQRFGEQAVFMDVAAIEPGRDFRKAIDEHVASCGVLLAVIGKNWTDAKNEAGQRRLDDALDFVRLETASALKRDIPVVPVLVHGATMPRADQLPPDLADLAFRNAIELTHARWESDISLLAKALGRYVTPAPEAQGGPVAAVAGRGAAEPKATVAAERQPRKTGLMIAIAAIGVAIAAGVYWVSKDDHDVGQQVAGTQSTTPPVQTGTAALPEPATEIPKSTPAEATKEAPKVTPPEPQKETPKVVSAEAPKETLKVALAEAPKEVPTEAPPVASTEAPASTEPPPPVADARRTRAVNAPPANDKRLARIRANWHMATFPEPNAGALAFRIMPDGNPACASYDQASCLWGVAVADLDFTKMKPLVCGKMHQAVWGATGYEDPKHWCNLAKVVSTVR